MARPKESTLKKAEQKKAVSLFKKGMTNVREIAKQMSVPRHQVMFSLEEAGLKSYSDGSYC